MCWYILLTVLVHYYCVFTFIRTGGSEQISVLLRARSSRIRIMFRTGLTGRAIHMQYDDFGRFTKVFHNESSILGALTPFFTQNSKGSWWGKHKLDIQPMLAELKRPKEPPARVKKRWKFSVWFGSRFILYRALCNKALYAILSFHHWSLGPNPEQMFRCNKTSAVSTSTVYHEIRD